MYKRGSVFVIIDIHTLGYLYKIPPRIVFQYIFKSYCYSNRQVSRSACSHRMEVYKRNRLSPDTIFSARKSIEMTFEHFTG
jgi:hypothetical protein